MMFWLGDVECCICVMLIDCVDMLFFMFIGWIVFGVGVIVDFVCCYLVCEMLYLGGWCVMKMMCES